MVLFDFESLGSYDNYLVYYRNSRFKGLFITDGTQFLDSLTFLSSKV